MHLYVIVLLAIVFINVFFTIFSVDRLAHTVLNTDKFDLFLVFLIAMFIILLAFVFMYMLANAEKAY